MAPIPRRKNKNGFRISIMTRLFSAFSLLLVSTVLLLYTTFSDLSQQHVLKLARQNIATILEMSEDQLHEKAASLDTETLSIMVNEDFYGYMALMKENTGQVYDYLHNTIKQQYLPLWFRHIAGAVSIQILYGDYVFAFNMGGRADYDAIQNSQAWERIQQAQGSIVWFPPDYSQQYFSGAQSAGYLWVARVLNITDAKHIKQVFSPGEQKPVLIVSLSPDYFSSLLLDNIKMEGVQYALLDETGAPFSASPEAGKEEWDALARHIAASGFSPGAQVYDDGNSLYFYIRSQSTGWYHVVYLPRNLIAGDVLYEMSAYFLRICAMLLPAMLIMSVLFSKMLSQPIKQLFAAVRQMEDGKFGCEIQYHSTTEMGYLIDQFNRMNHSIQHLIQENYQVRLREKDAEIMSLTIQFNPHYLYNTLNAIHWVALRGDAREAAEMIRSLALMMRYTSDQKQERTLLKDDIEWMQRYLYLMEGRYGDLYTTQWRIEPGLESMLVPKLFLQPLVENCIIHGFKDMETGGLIIIEGRDAGATLEFTVRDNGCGMTSEQLDALFDPHLSVGMVNVRRRIQLMYGDAGALRVDSSPNAGTCVSIIFPKESTIL